MHFQEDSNSDRTTPGKVVAHAETQVAIASCVFLATNLMQPLEQREEFLEILRRGNDFFRELSRLAARHDPRHAKMTKTSGLISGAIASRCSELFGDQQHHCRISFS